MILLMNQLFQLKQKKKQMVNSVFKAIFMVAPAFSVSYLILSTQDGVSTLSKVILLFITNSVNTTISIFKYQ